MGDGNEVLGFVEGRSPQPEPWNNDAVVRLGESLGSARAGQLGLMLDAYGLSSARRLA